MKTTTTCILLGFLSFAAIHSRQAASSCFAEEADVRAARSDVLRGSLGVFSGEPRGKSNRTNVPQRFKDLKSGKAGNLPRVDVDKLTAELVDIKANTFNWMIWFAPTDWDDLQRFLPLAAKNGISVWVTVMPPKQQLPRGFPAPVHSEPYRLNFKKWAEEIAKLSLREPNLVAWSIDDFSWDLDVFTPEKMKRIVDRARSINPRLAFVPCLYYPTLVKEDFAKKYGSLIDGVLFPYRHDSAKANLTDPGLVEAEIKRIREVMGPSVPIVVDVYATAHSALGSSTPEYVRQVMLSAKASADGVHVYCHQSPVDNPDKHEIVKKLFHLWTAREGAANFAPRDDGDRSGSKSSSDVECSGK